MLQTLAAASEAGFEALILADVGVTTTHRLIQSLKQSAREHRYLGQLCLVAEVAPYVHQHWGLHETIPHVDWDVVHQEKLDSTLELEDLVVVVY